MLVHNFIHGRPVSSPKLLAEAIVLCTFPHISDPDNESDQFVRILETDDGGKEFFCYEHQFSGKFRELSHRFEFEPCFHCSHDEALLKEKAIATLVPWLFKQEGRAKGMHGDYDTHEYLHDD